MNAIDLFAGAGGFSTGATMAGCTVVWAANHWPAAVQAHANNHPNTVHVCQDLQQAAIKQANAILEAAEIWSGRGWTTAQAYDVAQAGIDAVMQWANQPKDKK